VSRTVPNVACAGFCTLDGDTPGHDDPGTMVCEGMVGVVQLGALELWGTVQQPVGQAALFVLSGMDTGSDLFRTGDVAALRDLAAVLTTGADMLTAGEAP
jgi:hypothetical protein